MTRFTRHCALIFLGCALLGRAEDWPEWRGKGRQGIWRETGIIERFPPEGLKVVWRREIKAGYSGPSVARGRVFVMDYERGAGTLAQERVLCLEESTGKTLWTRDWATNYRGLDYANGPRATPTVDGDRVYVLGAMGNLRCLRVRDGSEVWSNDFVKDFATTVPGWGMSAAPVISGPALIAVVGGRGNAKVVAFDKHTGHELWRALPSENSEPGYSQPVLIEAGGRSQLILWHTTALESLDPASGKVNWSQPFRVTMNTPIATPAWDPPHLLVSGFFDGARMMELMATEPKARLLWSSRNTSETKSDKLNALMSQPIIEGDFIYGICSYGQLRCLRRSTGEQVWETQQPTRERARNASAWMVRQGGRVVLFNDRGELILARLTPAGYQEISRTKIIQPTSPPGARREYGAVNWSHPAFANRHIVVRNDVEAIRLSLDARDYVK
ncbi:MAG TPA: PQQ-binding-like beta-propeller repeat protein [Bryobacteraceae bacterium]|nr:PQQ-binding-like beta-propeller repeat protein [Bryobacteraceae bacterium]